MIPERLYADVPPVRTWAVEQWLGAVAAVIGAIVLAGWALDIPALERILPGTASMKPNTALALVMCGAAFVLSTGPTPVRWHYWVGLSLANLVVLLCALTLIEELYALDFGIDQLLFGDLSRAERVGRPGRMSPATAFTLLLEGVGLVLLAVPERVRLQFPFAAALNASVVVIGVLSLAGHLSHRVIGYAWGMDAPTALHTALALLALGVAGLARARRRQATPWALGRAGTAGFVIGTVLMLGAPLNSRPAMPATWR